MAPAVKPENMSVYEIEEDLDFDFDSLSAEEQKEITDANNAWEEENLIPLLTQMSAPCSCRMGEIQQRIQRRASLLNLKPNTPIAMTIEQEDIDAYEYGVVVVANKGHTTRIKNILQKCKKCGTIKLQGDIDVLTRMIARDACDMDDFPSKVDEDDENAIDVDEKGDPDEYLMEDLDTGECIGAASMDDLLSGRGKPVQVDPQLLLPDDEE